MDYIIKNKLSGKGSAMQRNPYPANFSSKIEGTDGGKKLPLFSILTNPQETINRLMTKFRTDMLLFGYNYRVDNDSNVIALCENYKEFNMCC